MLECFQLESQVQPAKPACRAQPVSRGWEPLTVSAGATGGDKVMGVSAQNFPRFLFCLFFPEMPELGS